MSEDRPQAPDLTLTAIGTGKTVTLNAPGVTTVLICFTQETQRGADAVEAAVHEVYPRASRVLVAHVVDLNKVPRIFHKIAETMLDGEFKKAVAALAPGVPPERYVVILPDWDGAAVKGLGLGDVSDKLGVAVISGTGALVGIDQSDDPSAGTMALLARAGVRE